MAAPHCDVLVTDGEMSQEEASEVRERIPDALRDRVLVTSGLSAFVVKPRMTKL